MLAEGFGRLAAAGEEFPFSGIAGPDDVPGVVDDDAVDVAVDGAAYEDRKAAAMRAHASQIAVDGPFFALSNGLGQPYFATEYYRLVRGAEPKSADGGGAAGRVGRGGRRGRATDLFEPPSGGAA